MIRQIALEQLRVGMYVHKLGGSWLDHPFWKSTFPIDEIALIRKIAVAGVKQIWIDTTRGLDVSKPDEEDVVATYLATMIESSLLEDENASCSFAEELGRARQVVRQTAIAARKIFDDVRLGKIVQTEDCLPLVEDITNSVARNRGAIISLARLKTSDDYTYMHSVAVCALMVALARQLGLDDATVREAGVAGLVHDIGKAAMPLTVLGKPGALTPAEFAVMRGHPQAGYQMLQEAGGFGDGSLDVCLYHHEKINGRGYPHGIGGDRIPYLAKLGAICDVYDAVTSQRCYKRAWDPARSIREMAQWSRNGHFDDAVFQAFVKSIGIYPVGSLVRLASGRLAVVVDQASGSLLKPLVRAIFVIASRQRCDEIVDLAAPGCTERIVAREKPEDWGILQVDDYWMDA